MDVILFTQRILMQGEALNGIVLHVDTVPPANCQVLLVCVDDGRVPVWIMSRVAACIPGAHKAIYHQFVGGTHSSNW